MCALGRSLHAVTHRRSDPVPGKFRGVPGHKRCCLSTRVWQPHVRSGRCGVITPSTPTPPVGDRHGDVDPTRARPVPVPRARPATTTAVSEGPDGLSGGVTRLRRGPRPHYVEVRVVGVPDRPTGGVRVFVVADVLLCLPTVSVHARTVSPTSPRSVLVLCEEDGLPGGLRPTTRPGPTEGARSLKLPPRTGCTVDNMDDGGHRPLDHIRSTSRVECFRLCPDRVVATLHPLCVTGRQ